MRKAALFGTMLGVGISTLLGVLPSNAQATRTWVSGVGDDVNPCSRTAPCKTFAGAISKTASGGEINCVDAAGFGAVTITKSMTISCMPGTADVLVAGTNGVVVQSPADSVVVLRGISIEGIGPGTNGIQFMSGGALTVDNVTIQADGGIGIEARAPNSTVLINNSTLRGMDTGVLLAGEGTSSLISQVAIQVKGNGIETSAKRVALGIDRSVIDNSGGRAIAATSHSTHITNSVISGNSEAGSSIPARLDLMASGAALSGLANSKELNEKQSEKRLELLRPPAPTASGRK